MTSQHDNSGYKIRAVLNMKKDHYFVYHYQLAAGGAKQDWAFSGKWQEKNKILVLLIRKSSYLGEERGGILFWRLLQIGHSHLVYVRTAAVEMQAMRRVTNIHSS